MERSLLGLAIIIIAIFIATSIIKWYVKKSATKEILGWINVSVVEIENTIPPGILIEVENTGKRAVGMIHFRLVFSAEDKTFCWVDADVGNFKPNEKRSIQLKCAESDFKSRHRTWRPKKVSYTLVVFPEWKDALEPIKGEFELKEE